MRLCVVAGWIHWSTSFQTNKRTPSTSSRLNKIIGHKGYRTTRISSTLHLLHLLLLHLRLLLLMLHKLLLLLHVMRNVLRGRLSKLLLLLMIWRRRLRGMLSWRRWLRSVAGRRRARRSRRLWSDRPVRSRTSNAPASTWRPHLLGHLLLSLLHSTMLWAHSTSVGMPHLLLLHSCMLGTHTSVLGLVCGTPSHGT